eukprot:TRINITY_DN3417_c0_g1_i1.p1 TRINITY_DN3417_c0_g1~~TRINITY_DN3417_c0_g1_i1.p1  ORF type:complete len:286 (+),score=52.24 TRINITY_DN3417_c0_g1_i1:82-939(+)
MIFTPLFEDLLRTFFGFDIANFSFYRKDGSINTSLPFSEFNHVVIATLVYFLTIFSIRSFMKERKPIQLKKLFAIHNVILSASSLILFVLIMETILPIIVNNGFYYSICSEEMFDGIRGRRLEFFYYINYLFKFYELVDTVFMALAKKNLEFLHVYHHSATFWLCFSQLIGQTSVQWFVISFNLFVHIIMYYYYARSALGARIWWKKYLTTLQIIQFVFDLGVVYYSYGVWLGHTHFGWDVSYKCHGTSVAAWAGCGLLSSYLLLFIKFYFDTYKETSSRVKKQN